MATKLKNLKISSTDLVTAGANPDAHFRLLKRKDMMEDSNPDNSFVQKVVSAVTNTLVEMFGKGNRAKSTSSVEKDAQTFDENMIRERLREVNSESWGMIYALADSLSSIICDVELTEDAKLGLMYTSLDEFAETLRNAIPHWAKGEFAENSGSVVKSQAVQAAFNAYWESRYAKSDGEPPPAEDLFQTNPTKNVLTGDIGKIHVGESHEIKKEVIDTVKIDTSKMTVEEQATLSEFEKKYGIAELEASPPAGTGDVVKGADLPSVLPIAPTEVTPAVSELHPEVKKALDDNAQLAAQVEELRKSLEIKDLTAVAKKYEIIGKKTDELAPKLYALRKAGGTAYEDTIALLDEQVSLVEKSGLFGELGSNASGGIGAGGELEAKATEIQKANTGMGSAEAFAKAYETYPDLAVQYEKTYQGRA